MAPRNPYTPMAFLEPAMARRVTFRNYAAVASLAILLWDILVHLPQDYKLAIRYRFNTSFVIYCTARVTSLAYVLGFVIMTTAPVGNCSYIRQISILYPFTIPLTVVPLIMRAAALYHNNKYVIALCSVSWLAVLGSCIVVPIGSTGVNIGTTKYCLDSETKTVNVLALLSPFIHDSLIFMVTSWALMRASYATDSNMTKGSRDTVVLGRRLPAFSKSILGDGQFYYLATLILNLTSIVLFYQPRATTPYSNSIPVFVTLNTMSSYVYRSMHFNQYRDYSTTTTIINNSLQRDRGIVFNHSIALENLETGAVSSADSDEKVGELVEDVSGSSLTSKAEKTDVEI